MSERPPDFDELVGAALDAHERARLHRVHELLVEAGPPPELTAPAAAATPRAPDRRRGALLALAAALAVSVFAVGALVGERSSGRAVDYVVEMNGAGTTADASASLTVFEIDAAGNWPMEMKVDGLARASSGRPFELWLTRKGELGALCGSFVTDADGSASVPLNAPWEFDSFDGWVVVEEGSRTPLLST